MSIEYTAPPQSRNEAILADTINDVKYTDPPQSRIEDLLIDLNGKVIGKQDALTEEQLAAVNSGINGVKVAKYDDIYAVMNYNALSHNGIYRGKDLTNIYTVEEIYERVHNGTFEDLYLGDYITVSFPLTLYRVFTGSDFVEGTTYYERSGADLNHWVYTETSDTTYDSSKTYYTQVYQDKMVKVDCMFCGFNYYYRTGRSNNTILSNHIVMTFKGHDLTFDTDPVEHYNCPMNPTMTTEGGYFNSEMHQTVLPCIATGLKQALNGHILAHSNKLTTGVNPDIPSMMGCGLMGASSSSDYSDVELQLMSISQLLGIDASSSWLDAQIDNRILPVYNFIPPTYHKPRPQTENSAAIWVKNVASSKAFVFFSNAGMPNINESQNVGYYISPIWCFG